MSRQDYRRAAQIVAEIADAKIRNMVGNYFALYFHEAEPATFDVDRFRAAANIGTMVVTKTERH